MYKIFRNEINEKICLCTQKMEDIELFKIICKNSKYEIYEDDINVTNKYTSEKEN